MIDNWGQENPNVTFRYDISCISAPPDLLTLRFEVVNAGSGNVEISPSTSSSIIIPPTVNPSEPDRVEFLVGNTGTAQFTISMDFYTWVTLSAIEFGDVTVGVEEIEVTLEDYNAQQDVVFLAADSLHEPGGKVRLNWGSASFSFPIDWIGGPGNWGAAVNAWYRPKILLESGSLHTLVPMSSVPTWQAYSTPTEQGWQRNP